MTGDIRGSGTGQMGAQLSWILDVGAFGGTPRALLGPPGAPVRPRSHFPGPERVDLGFKSGFERVQSASNSIATASIVQKKPT